MNCFQKNYWTTTITFVLTLVISVTHDTWAANDKAGITGFNFLKVTVGARPSALGGAYTATTGDLEASPFNPAGVYGIRQRAGVVALASYLVDTEAGYISIALPNDRRIWAASVNYFTYGTLQKTNADGVAEGTFGAFDIAATITTAQRMWKRRIVVGASVKSIYSSIGDYTSDAYAVDLGVITPGPIAGMKLGASISNLGSVRSGYTDGYKDSLPAVFRTGFSHRLAHAPLLILADINFPNDGPHYFAFGAELKIGNKLFLRPGYSLQQTGSQGDESLGLTAGAGMELQRYRVDYAFASYPSLGDVHRLSVTGRI